MSSFGIIIINTQIIIMKNDWIKYSYQRQKERKKSSVLCVCGAFVCSLFITIELKLLQHKIYLSNFIVFDILIENESAP